MPESFFDLHVFDQHLHTCITQKLSHFESALSWITVLCNYGVQIINIFKKECL